MVRYSDTTSSPGPSYISERRRLIMTRVPGDEFDSNYRGAGKIEGIGETENSRFLN